MQTEVTPARPKSDNAISVDVIIPTLGREIALVQAVDSAVAALIAGTRIIVVNDGSVDIEMLLRERHAARLHDQTLQIITNTGEHGASRARNIGADHSQATILFFLDDDDLLVEGALADAVAAAKNGYEYGYAIIPDKRNAGREGADVTRLPIRNRFAPTSAAFWINRHVFNDCGQFFPGLTVGEDFDLCARLLAEKHRGWCTFGKAVRRRKIADNVQMPSLVARTSGAETVRCRRLLMQRNIDRFTYINAEKYYLIEQYLRRAVRSGFGGDSFRVTLQMLPAPIAVIGLCIWSANMLFAPRDS